MLKSFAVTKRDGEVVVEAEDYAIKSACLVFYIGVVPVIAFANGTWLSVCEEKKPVVSEKPQKQSHILRPTRCECPAHSCPSPPSYVMYRSLDDHGKLVCIGCESVMKQYGYSK